MKINGLDDWYNFIKYRILEKAQTNLNILQRLGNLNFCILYKLLDIALGTCKKDFNDFFFFFYIYKAFADAAVEPIDFPLAPAYAVPKVRTK